MTATFPTRANARQNAWGVFAAVSLGIVIGRWAIGHAIAEHLGLQLSPLLFGAAGIVGAGILLVPSGPARALMLAASVLLGIAVTHARLAELPPHHLGRLVSSAGPADPASLVRLRGTVLDRPVHDAPLPGSLDEKLTRFGQTSDSFMLGVDTIISGGDATESSGTVRVFATALEAGSIDPGDRIELLGLLRSTRPAMNPGEPDTRAWARQSGRAGSVSTSADMITAIGPRGISDRARSASVRMIDMLRSAAGGVIGTDRAGAATVRAMLLGERATGGRETASFARTGVSHLLAISGFHLAVLIGLAIGALRLTGDRPRTEAVVGLALIVCYVALVPVRTPILRAALLAGTMLVAHFFSRRWDRLTLLGWVAVGIVLFRPMDLATLGFQLTVGVTALLIGLSDARHPWVTVARADLDRSLLAERPWPLRALDRLRSFAVTALLIWILAAPVIIWQTGSFNPLAPVAVVITTPIATLVQVFGMAGLIASVVSEPIGQNAIDAAHVAASALESTARFFESLRADRVSPPVSIAWAAAAVGAGVFLVVRARLRDWRPWLAVVVVLIWFGVETRSSGGLSPRTAARIDMLAVGDGSCLLVRAGDDAVLWDAGSLRPGIGVRTIPRSLRTLGSPRVRTALVTHANIDHYGALPDAARAIGLGRVLVSAPALAEMREGPADSAGAIFLEQMDRLGVSVEPLSRGATIAMGPAILRVLWPPADPPVSVRAANDRSLVARLEVPTAAGDRRVLLVGDIQRTAMLLLMAGEGPSLSEGSLRADIAELAHHGSHHPVAEEFLLSVGPSSVLQSTGPSRAFDRRWNGVKRSLGAEWLVTAIDGAAWAEIGLDGSIVSGSFRVGSGRRNDAPRR